MNWCCDEPGVDDVLSDPLIQSVMAADGVDHDELHTMLSEVAEQIGRRPSAKRKGLFARR